MLQVCAAYVRVQVAHRSHRVRPGHPSSSVIHTYIHAHIKPGPTSASITQDAAFFPHFRVRHWKPTGRKRVFRDPKPFLPSFIPEMGIAYVNGLGSGSRSPINDQLLEVSRLRIRASSFELRALAARSCFGLHTLHSLCLR